ncbi:MAG TPA: AsmA family protein, partial [Chitinophagaceae bacterium]|nr:AsmA family protein [Chitinophagaceae bacterium]
MNLSIKKILFKTFKIAGIAIGSVLLLMFLLPYLFPDTVARKIKEWTNNSINGELNFSKVRLSFFNHFPSLTLTLYDFILKGSAPFQKDTLVAANEVALGINLWSVFSKKINIDEIYLASGNINIEVNEKGEPNYNVYISDTTATSANSNDSSGASLKIEKIQIEHSNVVYDDQSIPMLITAKEFNYTGKGDLSKAIFDLASHMQVDSFDLDYDNTHFIGSKKLKADLITKINTQSLAFVFEKNDLHINSLPVRLKGKFEFLENGYNMDFEINSEETNLHDVFTALPPEYLHWLDSTHVNGYTEISASLKGKYIAEINTMPDLQFNMKIRNGYIANQNAPSPVKNLFLNFESRLPSLNPDSLYVNIDSVFFNIDKDYFSSVIKIKGLNKPEVHAKINTEIDLEKWDKAFGLSSFDVKGRYNFHFTADGKYALSVVQKGLRRKDTVIISIPQFNLQSSLSRGYFKYASLPQAVNNISFSLNASCTDGDYHHTKISLENLNATAFGNYIKGYFKLTNANDFPLDANLQSVFHLADIKQFYPLDSMDIDGDLNFDIQSKGKYNPAKKIFPVTKANIKLHNGSLQTKYYPHSVNKIQVNALVTNTDGTMKELKIDIQPVSFEFEGQSFQLKADLKNFDNLKYNIKSSGVINVGNIYKVFSQQ